MKKMNFPSAHTVLLIVAALVALLTWLVPAGKYATLAYSADSKVFTVTEPDSSYTMPATQATLDQFGIKIALEKFTNGDIYKPVGIPGKYFKQDSHPQGIVAFIQSPLEGIMQAIDVILFVLILGGFIGVVHHTGAFDAGVAWLAVRLKGREKLLIILITSLIALGGTTFGLAEETIAFYPILIPVFLAAGYDAMVGLAAIYLGSCVGTMVSTVNPFSVIIASNASGINWTSGLYGRVIMLVVAVLITLWYIIRYAERVRKDASKSIIYSQKAAIEAMFLRQGSEAPAFTVSIRLTLLIFALSFILMIVGVSKLGWWYLEMTSIFFVGAILIAIVARIREKTFIEAFIKGSNELLSVALIIGLARGITVLMDNGMITDTILHASSGLVEGMPKGLFINVMLFIFGGLSFFISSSSGMAVLTMPIMAPLADVVGTPRELVVDAYQYGMGLMAFITPTGLILASLTMVDVPYSKWLKFVMPLLAILTLVAMLALTVSVYL
jgi:uncharacterized ion transporter superfamily protein YfcC